MTYYAAKLAWTLPLVLALFAVGGCGRELKSGASDINVGKATPSGIKQDAVIWNGISAHSLNQQEERIAVYPSIPPASGGTTSAHSMGQAEINRTIGDNLTAMPEVKAADVLVTVGRAYVAIVPVYGSPDSVLEDQRLKGASAGDVSDKLKSKIASRIQSMDPRIREVYVSSHPDMVEQLRTIATLVRQGQTADGYLQQFSILAGRLFPLSDGSPNNDNTR